MGDSLESEEGADPELELVGVSLELDELDAGDALEPEDSFVDDEDDESLVELDEVWLAELVDEKSLSGMEDAFEKFPLDRFFRGSGTSSLSIG